MTNTFQGVRQSAALEWRLLITRHVLRLELLTMTFGSKAMVARQSAGVKSADDGEYYQHFMMVKPAPGEAKSVPMKLAQMGHADLFPVEGASDTPQAVLREPSPADMTAASGLPSRPTCVGPSVGLGGLADQLAAFGPEFAREAELAAQVAEATMSSLLMSEGLNPEPLPQQRAYNGAGGNSNTL